MHGTYIKVIDAQQTIMYNIYKNTKPQLLKKGRPHFFCKKIRKAKQLTAQYIQTKVNGNNMQSKKAKIAANKQRLTQEIKLLYCKKQKLDEQLYRIHLECANNWNSM